MREERFQFTRHAGMKMRFYGVSESRVKRIIRFPRRVEEGILPEGIAVMQPAGKQEIWVMYKKGSVNQVRIITVWRYPGKSPVRDPVPGEVLKEIQAIIFSI